MALDNNVKIIQSGDSHILYDAALIANPDTRLFKKNSWQPNAAFMPAAGENSVGATTTATAIGRAPVVFFNYQDKAMVLKHYYRGGLVAKLVRDNYLGWRVERSRAFLEWCLLRTMKNCGLPVPTPVAARVRQQSFFYQADLITLELENTTTLADCLSGNPLSPSVWKQLGICIKQFHQHDIYHADLNARNILLAESLLSGDVRDEKADDEGADRQPIYLIDFDRGAIRATGKIWGKHWREANLQRLLRSLNKIKNGQQVFHFGDDDWAVLLAGYKLPPNQSEKTG